MTGPPAALDITDTLGRFVLASLTPGAHKIDVFRIGSWHRDTTLILRDGDEIVLNVNLTPLANIFPGEPTPREAAEAAAAIAAAGQIDSVADGLLHGDTTRALSYRGFSERFLFAAIDTNGAGSTTVVSPVSAATALSLLWMGARDSTAAAIGRVLGLGALSRAVVGARDAALIGGLDHRSDVILDIGNAVWVSPWTTLRDEFTRLAGADYRAMIARVPLDQSAAVTAINHWADSVTRGMIPRVLAEPLDARASMYLANAVYFKGKWLAPFRKSQTQTRDFTQIDGQRVRVPMMDATGAYGYRREPGYRLLRLPYRGGRVAMYIVLPDSGVLPSDLARRMDATGWPAFDGPIRRPMVHVVLPKLHVEQQLDLRPLLSSLGMGIAFDPDHADFGDLAQDTRGDRLAITRATQKVYLDVDEEGTVAAAATGIEIGPLLVPPLPVQFIVDRPFLFLLRDEVSGVDLFAGWIAHP